MAQSVPDRSIINELAFGYLDAYYSTDKLQPAKGRENKVANGAAKIHNDKSNVKDGSAKKRASKNGSVKH